MHTDDELNRQISRLKEKVASLNLERSQAERQSQAWQEKYEKKAKVFNELYEANRELITRFYKAVDYILENKGCDCEY